MLEPTRVRCPFCGERFETSADASGGNAEYIEDCPVCCRPIHLQLRVGGDGAVEGLDADRDE